MNISALATLLQFNQTANLLSLMSPQLGTLNPYIMPLLGNLNGNTLGGIPKLPIPGERQTEGKSDKTLSTDGIKKAVEWANKRDSGAAKQSGGGPDEMKKAMDEVIEKEGTGAKTETMNNPTPEAVMAELKKPETVGIEVAESSGKHGGPHAMSLKPSDSGGAIFHNTGGGRDEDGTKKFKGVEDFNQEFPSKLDYAIVCRLPKGKTAPKEKGNGQATPTQAAGNCWETSAAIAASVGKC